MRSLQPVIPILLCSFSAFGQNAQPPAPLPAGTVSGTVVDRRGSGIEGASVRLSSGRSAGADVRSGADGRFSFPNVPPGPFELSASADGFAVQKASGSVGSGDSANLQPIVLTQKVLTSDVEVNATPAEVAQQRLEIAEEQIKEEERQRVLGFLPQYAVSYNPDALPLIARQKFELAWKPSVDPVTFAMTGIIAGAQQARNDFSGFGQGAKGYASRYGAAYGNLLTRKLISDALLPSLFRQDPRYFYRGTGSTKSRIIYAISRAVIAKGDNGKWQPNYSGILGGMASGALSNLYYPAKDRKGVSLTLENAAISIGTEAAAHLLQEFLFKQLIPAHHKGGSQAGAGKP